MGIKELPQVEKDVMIAALENLKRNMSTVIEYNDIMAVVRKKNYEAHLAQGFTPEQALQLCK